MLAAVSQSPPSTAMFHPVTYWAAGPAMYKAQFEMSYTSHRRWSGTGINWPPLAWLLEALVADACSVFTLSFISELFPRRSKPSEPAMHPGTMPLTRTPYGPHSVARTFVRASTPALAAPACACRADPFQWIYAEILMMQPERLGFIAWMKTALLILNVPRVSISIIVRNAFVLSFSAVARKFPAAPLRRISTLPYFSTTCLTTLTQVS